MPTAASPVPALEVRVRVTVLSNGESKVSLEGSEFEYSGISFAGAAQSLLNAALEDKARRRGVPTTRA